MKRLIQITKVLLLATSLIMTSTKNSFAHANETVNNRVALAFQKEFSHAENVSWESSEDLFKATFKLGEQVMNAYYDASGTLLAIMRNIPSTQLPFSLLKALRKKYAGYWITELYEISAGKISTYYIKIENADQQIVLKAKGNGSWKKHKQADK